MKKVLPNAISFDLNKINDFLALSRDPSIISDAIGSESQVVVIEEIPKVPHLLNEVQHLIEDRGAHFLLTGSSVRKLRQRDVNLDCGLTRTLHVHPLLLRELGDQFNLTRALTVGTLPSNYFSSEPREDLDTYLGVYLKEEILAEGLVRDLPAFSRALDAVALGNASTVNFERLASQAQVPRSTIREHFEILKDTIVLYEVPAWRQGVQRKATTRSKYYFFDIGVVSTILGRSQVRSGTPEFGVAFETWLLHELRSWMDYQDMRQSIQHWRSASGIEVDFLIGDEVAIKVNATTLVNNRDLKGLKAIRDEGLFKHLICVSQDRRPRTRDGIEILPYEVFLNNLWNGVYSD